MNSARVLRPSRSVQQIYLYRHPVDFRRNQPGLSAIVEQSFGKNPFSGTMFVFRNRACNKIKILLWEDNGFVLYYKSLAEERFHWPERGDALMSINGEQLNWLLDGYNIESMKPHRVLDYECAC